MKILNGEDTEREYPMVKINVDKAPSDKEALKCVVDIINFTGLVVRKNKFKELKQKYGALVSGQQ